MVEEDAAEGTGDGPVGISALMVVPFGHIGEEGIVEVDAAGGIGIFDGGEDERGGPPPSPLNPPPGPLPQGGGGDAGGGLTPFHTRIWSWDILGGEIVGEADAVG